MDFLAGFGGWKHDQALSLLLDGVLVEVVLQEPCGMLVRVQGECIVRSLSMVAMDSWRHSVINDVFSQ